jgi:hypothetical protein
VVDDETLESGAGEKLDAEGEGEMAGAETADVSLDTLFLTWRSRKGSCGRGRGGSEASEFSLVRIELSSQAAGVIISARTRLATLSFVPEPPEYDLGNGLGRPEDFGSGQSFSLALVLAVTVRSEARWCASS